MVLVMRNLLSNALKFTKASQTSSKTVRVKVEVKVFVSVEHSQSLPREHDVEMGGVPLESASVRMLQVHVVDSGVGIAQVRLTRPDDMCVLNCLI